MKAQSIPKPIGRPRSFDEAAALEAAMHVFWRKGYEGASLADLTEAMGINKPSLYAAFGDKEELFRRVLERYEQGPASYVGNALQAATARDAMERLLQGTVNVCTDPAHPRGCLMVHGALVCSNESETVREELSVRRETGEKLIQSRLKRAQEEGDLPRHVNAGDLARYVATVIRGISVQAADGATREELRQVIQIAMKAWPQ